MEIDNLLKRFPTIFRLLVEIKIFYLSLFATFVLGVACVMVWAFSPSEPTYTLRVRGGPSHTKKRWDHSQIGRGAFKLSEGLGSFTVPNLEDEIALVSQALRPGMERDRYLIGLTHSKDKKICTGTTSFYLTYSDGSLIFASTPSPLKVTTRFCEDGLLEAEVHLFLEDGKGRSLFNETGHFTLKQMGDRMEGAFIEDEALTLALNQLRQIRWCGPDKLFELYGDGSYATFKGKERLLLSDQILYVKESDLLTYCESSWRVLQKDEETKKGILARISHLTRRKMEIDVWDETGLYSKKIELLPTPISHLNVRPETLFQDIHQRTTSTVSLKLDKKSQLLKRGDWVIKGESGWRILKTWPEVEKYLAHQLKGEMFVFDGLEKKMGKAVLLGHLFDATRSQVMAIRLPLSARKPSKTVTYGRPQLPPRPPVDVDDYEGDRVGAP